MDMLVALATGTPTPMPSPDPRSLSASGRLNLADVTPARGRLPDILDAVRARYHHAPDRFSYREATLLTWVARYLQFYVTKPLGLLNATHAAAFLSHLGRQPSIRRADQMKARDAIAFFHTAVLQHPDFSLPADYVQATMTRPRSSCRDGASVLPFWIVSDHRRSASQR